MANKCVVIVQARLGSKRMPKKILCKLGDRTMLEQIVRRCKAARTVDAVVVACATGDDTEIFEATGITCFPGSETDLYGRLLSAAKANQATHFVRVTADCPFVCPRLIEFVSWNLMNSQAKVVNNWKKRTFPDGLDLDAYEVEWLSHYAPADSEYFSQEIVRTQPDTVVMSIENPSNLSLKYRLTVDYPEDLEMARCVYDAMGKQLWESQTIINYLENHPKVNRINHKRIDGRFGEK